MSVKVLAFGEILWDIINNKPHIGGAPFNLAAHLAKMGIEAYMISSLGEDDLGKKAVKKIKGLSIKDTFINVQANFPTGTVDVVLDSKGIPDYTINEKTAWDNLFLTDEEKKEVSETDWDLFCFGTLAQRTGKNRKLLNDIFENIKAKEVFYDINLRQNYYDREWIENSFKRATILKINDDEASFLSEYLYNKNYTEAEIVQKLAEDFNIRLTCVTRGAKGAAIYYDKKSYENPGIKVKVGDTVGAGDSFSAGFIFSLLNGQSPEKSLDFAIKVGGFVASCFGAVPEYSEELLGEIKQIENN